LKGGYNILSMKIDFAKVLDELEKEKGISKDILIKAIEY